MSRSSVIMFPDRPRRSLDLLTALCLAAVVLSLGALLVSYWTAGFVREHLAACVCVKS